MSVLKPDAPVSHEEVVVAARTVLKRIQNHFYMAWREDRWYSDEDMLRQITEARREFRHFSTRNFMHPDDMFSLVLAQEVLIAALPDTPSRCISTLNQLGIHHEDSVDEDFLNGFQLIHLPWLFDWVRESRFPLAEVINALVVLGQERLSLMFHAKWSPEEILADTYSGNLIDLDTLRMLSGLVGDPKQ